MEQSDNDADIVRSLLFLMDSNIETKNDDFAQDGEMINLKSSSNDYLSQGHFAGRDVGLESTEIVREYARKSTSPESSLPIEEQDSFSTHRGCNPDPANANSDASLCSLSDPSISLYRDKRGDCKTLCSSQII
jgi:hypothetical protein